MPELRAHILWAPKESEPELYQDAAAADCQAGRLAIADGVSNCLNSGGWADLLVRQFCSGPPAGMCPDALEPWCTPWMAPYHKRLVDWANELVEQDARNFSFPIRAQNGASATFLGLTVQEADAEGSRAWQAISLGDCCLFQWREGALVCSWPLERSDQFNCTPAQVSTLRMHGAAEARSGVILPGDRILLATDAVSAWICSHASEVPFDEMLRWQQAEWIRWLEPLRAEHAMHDDDATVLLVTYDTVAGPGDRQLNTPPFEFPKGPRRPGVNAPPLPVVEINMEDGTEIGKDDSEAGGGITGPGSEPEHAAVPGPGPGQERTDDPPKTMVDEPELPPGAIPPPDVPINRVEPSVAVIQKADWDTLSMNLRLLQEQVETLVHLPGMLDEVGQLVTGLRKLRSLQTRLDEIEIELADVVEKVDRLRTRNLLDWLLGRPRIRRSRTAGPSRSSGN